VATPQRDTRRDRDRRQDRSRSRDRRDGSSRPVQLTARREEAARPVLDDHAKGKSKGKGGGGRGYGGGSGGGYGAALAPAPRPGYDEDGRLKDLSDDPRYFEGAELGKAQKAALGIKGLHGRNTASFEPDSTLVRPAMRVFYGAPKKRYGDPLKPDDVVIVPDFFCEENNFEMFERLLGEVQALKVDATDDITELPLSDMPLCEKAVMRMCRYFAVKEDGRAIRLAWYRTGSDDSPLILQTGTAKFGNQPKASRGQNCITSLAFGATRELAFRRNQSEESLFFPQMNGALTFLGRDVCLRWQHGMNKCPQASERSSARGHISVTIMGYTESHLEDTILKTAPSDEKKGDAAFDGHCNKPCTDIVRPQMRIITTPPRPSYGLPLKHDDVVVVPEFFCKEDDWSLYYQLIEEMRQSQAKGDRKAEWLSWHEGAHLLSQNPTGSKTYQKVLDKMCDYFAVHEKNRGTRFNWYRDGSDWKPFHHDSAAFNPDRAKNQNTTIGISFGAPRELAFRHATTGELIYFPQKNGMLFYFGRDANIIWQHGINAMPPSEQDGKGRVSIILWGLATTVVDEANSPPMLDDGSRKGKGKGKGKGGFSMHGGGNQPCRDFEKGRCTYGERCRFSHESSAGRR